MINIQLSLNERNRKERKFIGVMKWGYVRTIKRELVGHRWEKRQLWKELDNAISCNLISSLTNRGTLRFQVFQGGFNSDVFLEFLRRLIRERENKVFLIVDRHPVHRSRKVQQWIAQHQDELELFYLPPYSPERNRR